MTRFPKFITAALLLSAAACQGDKVDRDAKARIFSAEDPPKVVASAAEKLNPQDVADNPRVARRILSMDAAEVTERLGPHAYTATVSYEWTGAQGAGSNKLSETRTFRAGPGGVGGDFHGLLENSRDQGLEVMRVDGKVYARNRYGTFRQRLRDRGMAERTRTELTGAIRDVDALFRGRLHLSAQNTVTYEGRTAWRYAVDLGPDGDTGTTPAVLPALAEPKGGRDESTRRRLAFFDRRVPQSLSGEVLVDAQTSVVLKVRLDGRIAVPANDVAGAAELRMVLESALSEIGKDPRLKAPEDFRPDADKPQGIADALDRFGIPRNKPEGATPAGAASPSEEPSDEEAN